MTNKFKIKTFNNISKEGLKTFKDYEVGDSVGNPDAMVLRSQKLFGMEFEKNLLAVGRAGAGVNNIPIDEMSEKGVVIFNTPGANANAVKELVISAMLLSARNLLPAYDYVKELTGNNDELSKKAEEGKKQFSGFEIQGKTLGIVGLGAIGVIVANAAIGLGMKVIGFDPAITIQNAWKLSAQVEKAASLNELYAKSDFITFHIPLLPQTKGMFSIDQLSQIRDKTVLLNFSRAEIVDNKAVTKGIEEGKIKFYFSDFPCEEFKENKQVFSFPHLGASTEEAEENCAKMVCAQIKDYLENGNISNSVNFPEVYMPKTNGQRLAIVNRNIPNMLATISGELGQAEININDMLNKSRGDYAYTLVDTDSNIPNNIIDRLLKVEGIIRVRLI